MFLGPESPLNGLAKLAEECGELVQVIGKVMAYGTGPHPDGTESLKARLEDEIADVQAAMELVRHTHGLDGLLIGHRREQKVVLFRQWHLDPDKRTRADPAVHG